MVSHTTSDDQGGEDADAVKARAIAPRPEPADLGKPMP